MAEAVEVVARIARHHTTPEMPEQALWVRETTVACLWQPGVMAAVEEVVRAQLGATHPLALEGMAARDLPVALPEHRSPMRGVEEVPRQQLAASVGQVAVAMVGNLRDYWQRPLDHQTQAAGAGRGMGQREQTEALALSSLPIHQRLPHSPASAQG